MDTIFNKKKLLNCGGKLLDLSQPRIMGILNFTPDSFYDGGNFFEPNSLKSQVEKLVQEEADILDLGAYSSRPFADEVTEKEELARLAEALEVIRHDFPDQLISVDTFRASVADFVATEFGVQIINDISAGEMDENMFEVIAKHNLVYMMMHMKGTPQDMQQNPQYEDLLQEMIDYFIPKIDKLTSMAVSDVVIDPGFGFGKTLEHNYQLLNKMENLKIFEIPVLAGISRKSMIYKTLKISAQESLNGTSALHLQCLMNGADILRVHDVKEAKEVIQLFEKIKENK